MAAFDSIHRSETITVNEFKERETLALTTQPTLEPPLQELPAEKSRPPMPRDGDEILAQKKQEPWRTKAACGFPDAVEIFYGPAHFERKDAKEIREDKAKQICGSCSVRAACLDYALATREPYGVWGGATEKERQQLLSRRVIDLTES